MARKRGSRFRKVSDAQERLEGLEQAQQDSRKKRTGKTIERTDKSKKRLKNAFDKIRSRDDVAEEYT